MQTTIIPYNSTLKEAVKVLNIEWLQRHFSVEPIDEILLSNPQVSIIDKGGFVFLVQHKNQIVGTFSFIKINDFEFELSKMAVSEPHQGLGIGNLILEFAIDFGIKKGWHIISLFSNTKLEPAIHLYKKFGFVEIEIGSSLYKRTNIKMEKIL